jgi:hypothetical protein
MSERDPEVASLLDTVDALLEALRRSMTLAEVLLVEAKHEGHSHRTRNARPSAVIAPFV